MHELIREAGSFGANPGTKDLARHLFTRMSCGHIVIVTDRPSAIYAPLRKQWLKLARKVQRECSSTLNAVRIFELNMMIQQMYTLRFTTKWPDDFGSDVYVATVEQLLRWAPECRTLYITCHIKLEDLHVITALMPKNGLVVECMLAA